MATSPATYQSIRPTTSLWQWADRVCKCQKADVLEHFEVGNLTMNPYTWDTYS
jgi:hypothetical protein